MHKESDASLAFGQLQRDARAQLGAKAKRLLPDTLAKIIAWRMSERRVRNHGFILDGYAKSKELLDALFEQLNQQKEAESNQEGADDRGAVVTNATDAANKDPAENPQGGDSGAQPPSQASLEEARRPLDVILCLEVSREVAERRLELVAENDRLADHNDTSGFNRRWDAYEAAKVDLMGGVDQLADDHAVCKCMLDTSELDVAQAIAACDDAIGKARGGSKGIGTFLKGVPIADIAARLESEHAALATDPDSSADVDSETPVTPSAPQTSRSTKSLASTSSKKSIRSDASKEQLDSARSGASLSTEDEDTCVADESDLDDDALRDENAALLDEEIAARVSEYEIYLRKEISPIVKASLIELGQTRPEDPVAALAQILLKKRDDAAPPLEEHAMCAT